MLRKLNQGLILFAMLFGVVGLLAPTSAAQDLLILDCSNGPVGVNGRGAGTLDCGTPGGSYTYDDIAAPSVLNPVTSGDSASNSIIHHGIGTGAYIALTRGAAGLDPQIASVIDVNADGTAVTFTIRSFNYALRDGSSEASSIDDLLNMYYGIVHNPNTPSQFPDILSCAVDGSPMRVEVLRDENQVRVSCADPFLQFVGNAGALYSISTNMINDLVADQGIATQLAIHPGDNGILDTAASGDDSVNGAILVDGGDGSMSPSGDDVLFNIATQDPLGLNANLDLMRFGGPFIMESLNSQNLATYSRNPHFFEVDSNGTRLPYLDEVSVIIIPTAGQNLSLTNFLNGTTDVLDGVRPQDLAPILSQAASGGFAVNQDSIDVGTPSGTTVFTTPNYDDPDRNLAAAFRNDSVRLALSLVADRVRQVNNVLLGIGTPLFSAISLGSTQYLSGRNHTCADLVAAFPSEAATCSDGVWSIGGITVNVTRLPSLETENGRRHVGCMIDYDGCVAQAGALLDSVGIVDTNGNGIRNIPANFDPVVGNPGGEFVLEIHPNTGNTVREEFSAVLAENYASIGIQASNVPVSFAQLVSQLLSVPPAHNGMVTIGFSGSASPATNYDSLMPCGSFFHFWHDCDLSLTDGLRAPTDSERAIIEAWERGAAAVTLEEAQEAFDEWQDIYLGAPLYMMNSIQNTLYAVRTDRFDVNNASRTTLASDVKYRVDQ